MKWAKYNSLGRHVLVKANFVQKLCSVWVCEDFPEGVADGDECVLVPVIAPPDPPAVIELLQRGPGDDVVEVDPKELEVGVAGCEVGREVLNLRGHIHYDVYLKTEREGNFSDFEFLYTKKVTCLSGFLSAALSKAQSIGPLNEVRLLLTSRKKTPSRTFPLQILSMLLNQEADVIKSDCETIIKTLPGTSLVAAVLFLAASVLFIAVEAIFAPFDIYFSPAIFAAVVTLAAVVVTTFVGFIGNDLVVVAVVIDGLLETLTAVPADDGARRISTMSLCYRIERYFCYTLYVV